MSFASDGSAEAGSEYLVPKPAELNGQAKIKGELEFPTTMSDPEGENSTDFPFPEPGPPVGFAKAVPKPPALDHG
jgi:hypothetical protein